MGWSLGCLLLALPSALCGPALRLPAAGCPNAGSTVFVQLKLCSQRGGEGERECTCGCGPNGSLEADTLLHDSKLCCLCSVSLSGFLTIVVVGPFISQLWRTEEGRASKYWEQLQNALFICTVRLHGLLLEGAPLRYTSVVGGLQIKHERRGGQRRQQTFGTLANVKVVWRNGEWPGILVSNVVIPSFGHSPVSQYF